MRRIGLVAAWILATLASTIVAANAVGSLRGQVTDVPAIAAAGHVVVEDGDPPATTSSSAIPPTTGQPGVPAPGGGGGSDDGSTDNPVDPGVGATSTTVDPPPTASTTTTVSPPPTTSSSSTTTTAVPTEPSVTLHQTKGGDVTVSAAEPRVNLLSAIPAPGFSAEVIDTGPDEVRIEFESEGLHVTFRARWRDGELEVEIEDDVEDD